jgi:hypothetical protein
VNRQPHADGSGEPREFSTAHDPQFAAELERRLSVVEAPGYEDSARRNLPVADYLALAALVVATTVLAYVWGL